MLFLVKMDFSGLISHISRRWTAAGPDLTRFPDPLPKASGSGNLVKLMQNHDRGCSNIMDVHSSNQSSPDGAEIKYKYGRQIKPCRTRIIAICVFTQSYISSKSMRNIVAHIVVLCSRLTAVTFQVKKSYHVRYSQK